MFPPNDLAGIAGNHPNEALAQFHRTSPDLAKRPATLDRGRYQRFAAFMKESGLIAEVVPVESYAVELE